jgi:hypothetical protein
LAAAGIAGTEKIDLRHYHHTSFFAGFKRAHYTIGGRQ